MWPTFLQKSTQPLKTASFIRNQNAVPKNKHFFQKLKIFA